MSLVTALSNLLTKSDQSTGEVIGQDTKAYYIRTSGGLSSISKSQNTKLAIGDKVSISKGIAVKQYIPATSSKTYYV